MEREDLEERLKELRAAQPGIMGQLKDMEKLREHWVQELLKTNGRIEECESILNNFYGE